MTGLLFAAALALIPQSGLSGSSDPRTESDFRCFGAALILAGTAAEGEADVMSAASLLGFYYLGRLEGREPATDWVVRGASIPDEKAGIFLGELERCAQEFEGKSEELISAGEKAGAS